MKMTVKYDPEESEKQYILDNLIASNKENGMPLKTDCWVFAYDAAEDMIGGCQFYLFPTVMWVNMLWIKPDYQKKGIGKKLLQQAEEEAKSRNCALSFLDTFEFQHALGFYENCGYHILTTVDTMAGNDKRYFLSKAL